MLKFQKLPAPYLDFCIVSSATGSPSDEASLGLTRFDELGLTSLRYVTASGWMAIICSDIDRVSVHGVITGISGIAKVGADLLVPRSPISPDLLEQVDPEVGIHTSFRVEGDEAEVRTDLFGYGQSYASQHDGVAIVSNRLHLHKMAMGFMGIPIVPDEAAVTAALFSLHGFFAQQNALSRTVISGVSLVPMSDDVTVKNGRYETHTKPLFAAAHAPQGRTYESLILSGVEKVLENTAAAVSSNSFKTVVTDVTGGKDSRLVLGAVTRTPGWEDRIRANTSGAVDSPDVSISAGLTNHYGVNYFEGDDTPQKPLSLADNLTFWRSYYFGQYHRFAAGAWSNMGENKDQLNLGGANGEIYRGFWTVVVEKYLTPEATTKSFAKALVRGQATKGFFHDEQLDELSSALADELDSYPAKTLRGKIEDHYLFHRNRTHCGLRGFTFYHDRLTWYPLMSADLLAASRMIPLADRVNNRVIHDVLRELDPDLTRFRFNSADDPFAAVRPERDTHDAKTLDEDTSAWAEATAVAANNVHLRRAEQKQVLVWADLKERVTSEALAALDALERMDKLKGLIPRGLRKQLTDCMETWPAAGYQVASRIFAVHDAFEEEPPVPAPSRD